MGIGRFFDRVEKPADALMAYELALRADPNLVAAQVNRGWNLYMIGNYELAEEVFLGVIQRDANSVAAFNLGLVYLARQKYDLGRESYVSAFADYGRSEAERIGAIDDLDKLAAQRPQDENLAEFVSSIRVKK